MKVDPYVHAALVLHGAGKEITKENLLSILKAAGAEVNEAKAEVLAEALKGVNIEEAISSAAVPVAVAQPSGTQQTQSEQPKKKEEKKEDEATTAEGLAALFG